MLEEKKVEKWAEKIEHVANSWDINANMIVFNYDKQVFHLIFVLNCSFLNQFTLLTQGLFSHNH